MPTTDKQKLENKIQKALRVNKAMAGKPGFDRYGAPTVATKRQIRDYYTKTGGKSILEVETPKKILGPDEGGEGPRNKPKSDDVKTTNPAKPTKTQPKRKKQKTASSVTKAGLVDLKDQIKISEPKKDLKKRPNITEEDRAKLDKLQKMKDRADKRQARKDRSTERLAFRMGEKATFQDAAALKQKRKQARRDYLRNFASQLARGEQAAPRTGFGEGEGNPNTDTSLAGNSGTQQEVSANKEMAGSDYKDIFSTMANIGNDNSSLTSVSYDRGMSGLLKLDEDSSPTTYMQKEYRKKRGY